MFQVVKNNVKMVRGDTGEMELSLTLEDGTAIDPAAYTAVLSLKKSIDDVATILKKTFIDGKISFSHEDTNNLPYGTYVYDVQVELLEDGSIHTIGYHSFVVLADVTRE